MAELPAGTTIVKQLLRDPLFARSRYPILSRLLPAIEHRHYPVDTTIFRANAPADGFYVLISGTVRLLKSDGTSSLVSDTCFGEESATDFEGYFVDAIATTEVQALYIPRAPLQSLMSGQEYFRVECISRLMSRISGQHLPVRTVATAPKTKSDGLAGCIGWLLAIVLPIIVWFMGIEFQLEQNVVTSMMIFSSTVIMWMFSLVDDYIPGLFAIVAILMAGLVPPSIVLAGFASNSFLMAMSILGLSTTIASSGLGYRASLLLLYYLPNSRFWNNFGIAMTGFFLTPMIPSINARLAMVSPIYEDLVKSLRFAPNGHAATQLAVSTFTGASLMSAMFVTSKSVNFAMFSLLPTQAQDQFQGFKWFAAAGVFTLILLLAHMALTALMFRGREKPSLDKERLAAQLELLGTLKNREWAAFLGIAVFILGMMTASFHHIQPALLSMTIFFGLLLFGSLQKKEFTEKVDWPFLIYLSELTGLVSVFNYLGLDQRLATALPVLGITMRDNFDVFVIVSFLLISLIRLVIPISITIVILITLFMPLAEIYGVNSWVVGFIILVLGEIWFLPYQCSYYQRFQELNETAPLYRESTFLYHNALLNAFRLLAIYGSFPYWKMLGLL
ncbi:MAG: anion permease [Magnetococcales bacterium]|nr:anion permease [Magnetococcales bacterium]MBF0150160.1 anion permease [Magnetococcales bacterium]